MCQKLKTILCTTMKGKTKSDNLSEEWGTLKNKSSGEKYGSPRIWWDSKKKSMLDFFIWIPRD